MKRYELMYILRPDWEEEKLELFRAKLLKALSDNGAEIISNESLGKRELAAEFKKCRSGFYYKIEFKAEPKALEEMQRVLTLSDAVLRFMNATYESVTDKSHRQPAVAA
jgi:small subunit ribosomal protein S6